jgi:hypothetical protein
MSATEFMIPARMQAITPQNDSTTITDESSTRCRPIYTVHPTGIWKYDPKTKQTTLARAMRVGPMPQSEPVGEMRRAPGYDWLALGVAAVAGDSVLNWRTFAADIHQRGAVASRRGSRI